MKVEYHIQSFEKSKGEKDKRYVVKMEKKINWSRVCRHYKGHGPKQGIIGRSYALQLLKSLNLVDHFKVVLLDESNTDNIVLKTGPVTTHISKLGESEHIT